MNKIVAKKKLLKLLIYLGLLVFIGFGLIGLYFFVYLNYELRKSNPTENIEEFIFIAPVFEPDTFVNLNLTYEASGFENIDSLFDNFEKFHRNYSDDSLSIFSFRGNAWRNAPQLGKIKSRPENIELKWIFYTGYDTLTTNLGQWGGGAGWTGQALLIRWDSIQKRKLGIENEEFLANPNAYEAIIGSLCGNIYFIDAETGKSTRQHLSIENPIKGTVAVDPRKNGLLYVGQGVKHRNRFGAYVFDMFSQEEIKFISGYDDFAYRRWCAFDSNPLIDKNSGTVFWPGENGLIYRFVIDENKEFKNLVKLRYK
ncbi:MAG: hypothetical protein GX879_07170, partial [Bacteroidales bacterium]|nr:hypothetical protein [Bacteroidales bacterium]